MKGKFITFEGCEGSGKSTQVKMLEEYLSKRGINYLLTREPGGTDISEKIRGLILDAKNDTMSNECEALLYSASRVEHLKNKVMPALSEGKLVICDRYIDSSFAYQSYARGLGDFVERVNEFAIKNCMPDLTIFINISPEEAFARKNGADENDRIEQAGIQFHNKVYDGYIKTAEKYKERFVIIDGHSTKEEIHQKIISVLKERNII